MADEYLSLAGELAPSDPRWVHAVLDDFDCFLSDHASAEKKASGMAMNVAAHYPDQPELLRAMSELAVEELTHYREVVRLMIARGITPRADQKDPYIHALNDSIRREPRYFLLDRLLVGAVVERRGAERFALLATALKTPELRKFYRSIASSEQRHWLLFIRLALQHCIDEEVWPRFHELAAIEADILSLQPLRAALH